MFMAAVQERYLAMPKRFRLIPVESDDVEAIQITDADSISRAVLWVGGVESNGEIAIYVPTTNEILRVSEGDYIVKDSFGALAKMTKEQFEKKYALI